MADLPKSQFVEDSPSARSASGDGDVRSTRKKRKSRNWHRTLGLLTALPLVWVLVTGALLNHSDQFGLDTRLVTHSWVLGAYGMTPQGEPKASRVHSKIIVVWDGLVFVDAMPVEISGDFLGAAADGTGYVIAASDSVSRLDASGGVIEILDALALPTLPLVAVGSVGHKIALKNADGWFVADDDWMSFSAIDADATGLPIVEVLVDDALKKTIRARWAGEGVPWSRVVLDLHGGRFFGSYTKYFYDFITFCALWLVGTGIVLQFRVAARNRKG